MTAADGTPDEEASVILDTIQRGQQRMVVRLDAEHKGRGGDR